MNSAILAAFISGLSGAAHCFGMCGGLAATLGLKGRRSLAIYYQIGRVMTYGLIGLTVGLIGQALPLGNILWLRALAGVLMLAMAAYMLGHKQGLLWLERLGGRLIFTRLRPFAGRFSVPRSPAQAWLAGMFWGLLPCGLVYSMLALALSQGSALAGSAVMISFGLGTIPAMLMTTLAGGHVLQLLQKKGYRRIAALSIALLALYTLWPVIDQLYALVH